MRRQYSKGKSGGSSRKTSGKPGAGAIRKNNSFRKRSSSDNFEMDNSANDDDTRFKKKYNKYSREPKTSSYSKKKRDDSFDERDSKPSFKSKSRYTDQAPTYPRSEGRGSARTGINNDRKSTSKKLTNSDFDKGDRLNKYIANAGMCSRREADTYISAGLVSINGKVITELGVRVMPGDEVKFGNERISPEKKVYLVLNKPKGYVTTVDDPEERKTVMDLINNACRERVVPVGRLDRNTTGILMFTNDGDLTKKLTHPSYNKKKIYHVFVNKPVTRDELNQIVNGIELEDGLVVADAVSYVNDLKTEIGIELHSGKNRVVRRIFEHFGHTVVKLDRVYFAGITKLNLPRGKWRFLTDREVANLKTGMYE